MNIAAADNASTDEPRPVVVGIGGGPSSWAVARRIIADYRDSAAVDLPATAFVLAIGSAAPSDSSPTTRELPLDGLITLFADQSIALEAGCVYAPAMGVAAEIRGGRLTAVSLASDEQAAPIDHLFASIAVHCKEFSVGIILSGAGTDGTLGLRAIGDIGGMTIAQEIDSADERSMPQAAATLGTVDHVLSPDQIPVEILHYAQHMQELDDIDDSSDLNRQIIVAIPRIAAAVEKHTQNDFKHYKTTTLTRRIRRRIHVLKLNTVEAYIDLLQTSREEALRLFRDLLISVTAFFRDPKAFDSLARDVLVPLVQRHEGDAPLRVWVPGCATGQEAYSIAMLLVEVIEQVNKKVSVQIFATDLDERALSVARTGGYPIGIQDEVVEPRLLKFFVKRGSRYFVTKRIRDMIVFSAHNLISDPPFTKVDLISCRNLLIYLGSHLQKKLIPLFHYATRPGGYLFLGPAETLSVNKELYRVLQAKHRLYQRRVTALDRAATLDVPIMNLNRFGVEIDSSSGEVDLFRFAQQIILGEFSPQWTVVDDAGQIQTLSSDPTPFLKMSGGQFKNNVISMAHENLRIGLRAAFSEAKKHRRRSLAQDMSVPVEGGLQRVHVTVQPMPEMGEDSSLHLVVFHRIGTPLQLDSESGELRGGIAASKVVDSSAGQAIEQLELELTRTREALERTVQELETSNEELKSTNEELLSMNEELQSANEELETSKEELQTSNEALVQRNNDIQNLLRSTQIATVFLDNDLRIRGFTPAVGEIYDLVETDVGRPLEKFVAEIQPMPPLPRPSSLADDALIEETIGSSQGRTYIRRTIPYRAPGGDNDGIVVTFSDVTELSNSQQLFKSLVDVSAQIVWITAANGMVMEDSPSWREFTGQTYKQWIGSGWADAIHPEDRQPTLDAWQQSVKSGEPFSVEYRLQHHSGDYQWTHVRAVANRLASGQIYRWVGMNTDIDERKSAEAELQRSNDLIRTIAENSTQALIMIDDKGYLTYCNQACFDMLGFDAEELGSKPLHDLIHHHYPDGRPYPISECPIDRALPEDFSVRAHEDLFFRKDGSTLPVLCAASPIFRDGKPASTVIEVRDITEAKQIELELRDREAHLRRVIDGSFAFLAVLDTEGRVLEINKPALQIVGVDRVDVIGKLFWKTSWWSADEDVVNRIRDAVAHVAGGEVYRADLPYFLADGVRRMVDFNLNPVLDDDGQVAYLVPSGVDITDRFNAEIQVRETRDRLDHALNRLEIAMQAGNAAPWSWNPETQRMNSDSALRRLFGFPDDDDKTLEEFLQRIDPQDAAQVTQAITQALTEGTAFNQEYRVRLPTADVRWIQARGQGVVDKHGKTVDFFGFLVDVTERHLYQDSIEAARAAAEAANRSKSTFLANMSHEIRTPMTAILGYIDLIADKIVDVETLGHVHTIRRNGDFLLDIINDILDLSKIEAGKLDISQETFPPARLIEDVRSIMNVRASETGIQLDIEFKSKLPSLVMTDAKRLKQILINLVGNAIKFTPEGSVKVVVDHQPGSLRFEIIDTGIGMSGQQIEKLFQPFSQGDGNVNREFGGTGLGLAISKRLAEMLGGKIEVQSELAHGSSFTVTVGVVEVAGSELAEPQHDTEIKPEQATNQNIELDCDILVVDDRRDIRFLSKTFLTRAGARVDEAEDGQAAIQKVELRISQGSSYDLVLLDMQMPKLDGYAAAKALRRLGFAGPIIALTADAMQGDMTRCLAAGCNDYLSKPIDKQVMLEKVKRYLDSGH